MQESLHISDPADVVEILFQGGPNKHSTLWIIRVSWEAVLGHLAMRTGFNFVCLRETCTLPVSWPQHYILLSSEKVYVRIYHEIQDWT